MNCSMSARLCNLIRPTTIGNALEYGFGGPGNSEDFGAFRFSWGRPAQ
jgi:hypothetical protein